MKPLSIFISILIMNQAIAQPLSKPELVTLSRTSCVEMLINGNRYGTGFYISNDLIVTCFHVVGNITLVGQGHNINFINNLQIRDHTGQILPATLISVPDQANQLPVQHDFAIYRVTQPNTNHGKLTISIGVTNIVGDDVILSGYPLDAPTMLTHKGYMSGITTDERLIGIQAPVNKGNSGGALMNEYGHVIGIVTYREGGISQALDNEIAKLQVLGHEVGHSVFNTITNQEEIVYPLATLRETIEILNKYISPGIGYAINIKYLRDYIQSKHIQLTN